MPQRSYPYCMTDSPFRRFTEQNFRVKTRLACMCPSITYPTIAIAKGSWLTGVS